jgi:hypothetical protein
MAIIYSYPNNTNVLDSDVLIGTSSALVNGRKKNTTKNFSIGTLASFVNLKNTLQSVSDNRNTIIVPVDRAKGIDITLVNQETVYQNGVSVTIPLQTSSPYPAYNPCPDAYIAKINGQLPNALVGFVGGFVVDATGDDNTAFHASLRTSSAGSRGMVLSSFDDHYGDYFVARKYILGVETVVVNITNDGTINSKSLQIYNNAVVGGTLSSESLTTQTIQTNDFNSNEDIYVNSIRIGRGGLGVGTNTVVGKYGLFMNTTGANNTAVGSESMRQNTTGVNNVAIGVASLATNTSGGSNVAIGVFSLFENTLGYNNIAIGQTSMYYNTEGYANVAIGVDSLSSNTFGSSNVAIGQEVMRQNTTGFNNSAIGVAALSSNTTGDSNVAMGGSSLQANTTGVSNVSIGAYSMLANVSGNRNTAIGENSGHSNSTGNQNTYIGQISGYFNTTGSNNTAVGVKSLHRSTTANNNSAFGGFSLELNTTGFRNTAIGYFALNANTVSNDNTAVGIDSLKVNVAGTFNTAVGSNSMGANISGINNVAMGYNALINNTTGSYNVAIGSNATNLANNNSNSIVIGRDAVGSGSNTVTLGNTSITTTRLRGTVQGGSFVKDSGTVYQTLMADGSTTPYFKYNFGGTLTHTGDLLTVALLQTTIPANSLTDYLNIKSVMLQQSGVALAGVQVKTWINTVNSFAGATQISNFSIPITTVFGQFSRQFSIQGGTLFGYSSTLGSSATGTGSASSNPLSIAFNTAVNNYFFVSVQLTNAADTVTLRNVTITN